MLFAIVTYNKLLNIIYIIINIYICICICIYLYYTPCVNLPYWFIILIYLLYVCIYCIDFDYAHYLINILCILDMIRKRRKKDKNKMRDLIC